MLRLFPESRELVSGDLGRALIDEFLRLASSVNDLDAFVARAHELGVMHRGWGASREHYDTIEEALSCVLKRPSASGTTSRLPTRGTASID